MTAPPGPPPPPEAIAQPPPPPTGADRTWILFAHFGGAIVMLISLGTLGWVPPLIVYRTKGRDSPAVAVHALAALNFQVFWSIIGIVGWVGGACGLAILVGVFLLILPLIATIVGTVLGIVGGVKAGAGVLYRYPWHTTFIRS